MQKKSEDFSMQEALRLMKTPAGQQLMEMAKTMDSGKLRQAAVFALRDVFLPGAVAAEVEAADPAAGCDGKSHRFGVCSGYT